VDELFAVTTKLGDFDSPDVDLLDADMLISDFADFGWLPEHHAPPSHHARVGVDMGALVQAQAAPPTTLVVATPSPLAALKAHWDSLTDAQKLGVALVASAVVVLGVGAITGALAAKAAVGHVAGHAFGGAAIGAAAAAAL
jgi:hypothetical protein